MDESDWFEDEVEEYPWPKDKDDLFKGCSDWWHNACVNQLPVDWHIYASGYRKAAQVLVDYCGTHDRDLDFLIYPIVFNYRQFMELQLKGIYFDCCTYLDRESITHKHKLEPLWKQCRQMIEEIWPGESSAELDVVEHFIRELATRDPGSMAFRYPVDMKGDLSLPSDLRFINVRHMNDRVNEVGNLLQSIATALSEYQDVKDTMEWEAGQDCGSGPF